MITSIDTLKGWFKTLDKPTQQQFYNWLDSYRHKNDKISFEDLSDEVNAILDNVANPPIIPVVLAPGVSTWDVPAGIMVEKVVIIEPTEINVSIGTSEGGNEYMEEQTVENGALPFSYDEFFLNGGKLWFTGLTENSIVKIFIR